MSVFNKQIVWIEKTFSEIKVSSEVALDLKYSSQDNFMNKNVYEKFDRCFVSSVTFQKFERACAKLRTEYPMLQFLIWDALRPRSVQAHFYEFLKDTPFQQYVAAPFPGSLHNFGMAMDLTLQTKDGIPLDMGTGFDDFRDLAQPKLESQHLASGELTEPQYKNRLILRGLLEGEGFAVLEHEWWHFNALPKHEVHGKYPILE